LDRKLVHLQEGISSAITAVNSKHTELSVDRHWMSPSYMPSSKS